MGKNYCPKCKMQTVRNQFNECLMCKQNEKFERNWHNKTLEEKVDWLYEKVKND